MEYLDATEQEIFDRAAKEASREDTPEKTTSEGLIPGIESMTEEEALKALGLERTEIYQGLEEILMRKSRRARDIVNWMQEKAPFMIPLMLSDGTMEQFLDGRLEEAQQYFLENHPKMQEAENVYGMDTLERIQVENRIYSSLWEIIEREILFRPIQID